MPNARSRAKNLPFGARKSPICTEKRTRGAGPELERSPAGLRAPGLPWFCAGVGLIAPCPISARSGYFTKIEFVYMKRRSRGHGAIYYTAHWGAVPFVGWALCPVGFKHHALCFITLHLTQLPQQGPLQVDAIRLAAEFARDHTEVELHKRVCSRANLDVRLRRRPLKNQATASRIIPVPRVPPE